MGGLNQSNHLFKHCQPYLGKCHIINPAHPLCDFSIAHLTQAIFLYCCLDCLSCPGHLK